MTKGTAMAQLVSLDKYRSSRRADAQSLGLKTAKGSKRRADICFDRSEFSVSDECLQPTSRSGSLEGLCLGYLARHRCFSIFRHAAESPLYTVCKLVHPSGRGRQYAVFQGQKRLKVADSLLTL